MTAPRLLSTLLSAALALAASPALADYSVSARGGWAFYGGDRVADGPSFGLQAIVGVTDRVSFTLSVDRSIHPRLADRSSVIDATTAAAGVDLSIDTVPVWPYLTVGPALQYAARRDIAASDTKLTWYLAAGVRTRIRWAQLGLAIRYLGEDFTGAQFPAYTSALVEVGWWD